MNYMLKPKNCYNFYRVSLCPLCLKKNHRVQEKHSKGHKGTVSFSYTNSHFL